MDSQLAGKQSHHPHLYLLIYAYAFSTFASGILMPIYAFYVKKIGGGIIETTWAIGLYSVLCGIGTIYIHKTNWSRKYRKNLLWIGWLCWVLAMSSYLIIKTILVLYVAQILIALSEAITEPIFDAEFSERASANFSDSWALFNGVISIFSGIATFAGGFIATYYGFDALLYCVIAMASLSFFLIVYYIWVRDNVASVAEHNA